MTDSQLTALMLENGFRCVANCPTVAKYLAKGKSIVVYNTDRNDYIWHLQELGPVTKTKDPEEIKSFILKKPPK